MTCISIKSRNVLASVLLFTICFSLYLKTLANQVYTADCGELIAVSYTLGIPHATGYSTYCLINRIAISALPFGSVAFRVSITSAVFGALAVVFLFMFLSKYYTLFASAFASLLLGLSFTFWSQSIIQEVYAMHMFFLCVTLQVAGKLVEKFSIRTMFLLLFVMGLSITNHGLTWFSFPAIILYLFLSRPCVRGIRAHWHHVFLSFVFFILALSTLLYFPVRSRSDCILRWTVCHHFDGFLFHVTGQQFRTLMFNQSLEDTLINLGTYFEKTSIQFSSIFFFIALYGAIVMLVQKKKLFVVFSVYLVLTAFFFLHYRIIDIEVYYLQSYIPLAVFTGSGLDHLYRISMRYRKRISGTIWITFFFASIGYAAVKNYHAHDRSANFLVFDWGMNVFNCVPPDGMLVTQGWSSPFVFFYFSHVLDYRPDVFVTVDYKGSTFFLATERGWDTHVVSTLPVELPGIDEDAFDIHGVVYQYLQGGITSGWRTDHTKHMRTRTLNDPSLFLDFHSQALKAKYIIIEGFWYLEKGDWIAAEEKFSEAEREAHQNPLIYNNLSCVFFKLGQYERAEWMAQRALKIDPDLVPAHHNLGNALLKQGRYQEAIAAFEEIQDNVVSLGRQREALGYLYLLSGDCDRAQRQFRRALSLFPKSHSARMNLGIAQQQCGNYNEALGNFDILMEDHSAIPEVYINRANVYIALERYDAALRDLDTVLGMKPESFEAQLSRGVVLFHLGELDDSHEIFHNLYSRYPENTSVLNNIGLFFYRIEKYEDAIYYWEKSIDIDPGQLHIRRALRELRFSRFFRGTG